MRGSRFICSDTDHFTVSYVDDDRLILSDRPKDLLNNTVTCYHFVCCGYTLQQRMLGCCFAATKQNSLTNIYTKHHIFFTF